MILIPVLHNMPPCCVPAPRPGVRRLCIFRLQLRPKVVIVIQVSQVKIFVFFKYII